MKNSWQNIIRYHHERGALLPALAAISLGMLIFLIVFGIEATLTKTVSVELRNKVESICHNLANNPTDQAANIISFRNEINSLQNAYKSRNIYISSATLIMPTVVNGPDNLPQKDNDPTESGDTSRPAEPTTYLLAEGKINDTGVGCAIGPTDSDDCTVTLALEKASATFPYPNTMWSHSRSGGHTYGCDVFAKVPNVITPGRREIRAKVVWAAPVNTAREAYDPSDEAGRIETSAGLSLILAPYVTTYSYAPTASPPRDGRFDLRSASPTGLYQALPSSLYPGLMTNLAPYDPNLAVSSFIKETPDEALSMKTQNGVLTTGGSMVAIPSSAADPKLTELRIGCMNPLVLVRNAFTSTLLELAIRHGELRTMTEVLFASPMHEIQSNQRAEVNPPVVLSQLGNDIAARDSSGYQHPFVSYFSGREGDPLTSDQKPHLEGWVAPLVGRTSSTFMTPPISTDLALELQAIVAAQLRSCFHLYSGSTGTNRGIDRPPVIAFSNPIQKDFEPSGYGAFRDLFAPPLAIKGNPYTGTVSVPWSYSPTWSPADPIAGLTLLDVVATMGSVQQCPYEYETATVLGGVGSSGPTTKCLRIQPGSQPRQDLEGDILGSLRYARGLIPGIRSPGLIDTVGSINASSIYSDAGVPDPISPLSTIPGTAPYASFLNLSPSSPARYTRPNAKTAVVVVAHRAPTDAAELIRIRAEIAALNAAGRPVHIVLFPSRPQEGRVTTNQPPTAPVSLCTILGWTEVPPVNPTNPPDCIEPAGGTINSLTIFSAWLDTLQNAGNYGTKNPPADRCNPGSAEHQQFACYWSDLLFGGGGTGQMLIVNMAKSFFNDKILRHEPKL